MTTLFNLFCPLFSANLGLSLLVLSLITSAFVLAMLKVLVQLLSGKSLSIFSLSLFPSSLGQNLLLLGGFFLLSGANLISLICYSYPLTTTLGFNLAMALTFWIGSVLLQSHKGKSPSGLLPGNSPWYLAPFLSLVELISITVRPVTLSFRLLANMSAGHVLLTLVCKLSHTLWLSGVLLGGLELMVAMVQAFVFLMLTNVYLEEALSH